ncbi:MULTISPECIES: hypothetical protein [unclassified Streptomyces]|uniref:hypothetical protein n=1 Tax=unclassified Streptomyces TaxID=2593676 RepID=UPI00081B3A88|nr:MULTISPECIES: hypothetical protein [unclassified Streptomyces]MYU32690.1 hypothetical protein [Streptomyces sp. SID8358]MYX73055.1 hypothetical protein [Streptomyces sp. SID3915]SCD84086.1 hypothetical protein GA0115239_109615 [Streptomyces sp. BpilaLS-43]
MSLLELITRADERSLAASGLACLERCLPPSGDGTAPEPLRPLWASCGTGQDWGTRLKAAEEALGSAVPGAERVRALIGTAPREFTEGPLRAWADACSLLALEVHRAFDPPTPDAGELPARCRSGETAGAGPLLLGELLRQTAILELLAETTGTAGGGAGLRRALDVSTEGQRVLRAVMSRRARGRSGSL